MNCGNVEIPSKGYKPRLLDLFCGAGGAARGYQMAGFYVVGVDIKPQRHYIGEHFVLGDALEYCREHGAEFDVIHASPPCQQHSTLRAIHHREYACYIVASRDLLGAIGNPWVIENVSGAPLLNPVMLCGTMFGLRLFRHRLFESSILLRAPSHSAHTLKAPRTSRVPSDGEVWSIYGHFSGVKAATTAMGVPWMTQSEAAQAIPPSYTKYVGQQLLAYLGMAEQPQWTPILAAKRGQVL